MTSAAFRTFTVGRPAQSRTGIEDVINDVERGVLEAKAQSIRLSIVESIHAVGTGHAGSSLSMVEILTVLYFRHLKTRPHEPEWPGRDYFVLSKGHGAPGLYATLAEAGYLAKEELLTLRRLGSRLQGHPNAKRLRGIDVSTGSLGQGISNAVGLALGLRHQKLCNRVYCLLGDGELQEGQNWEGFMAAAHYKLSNLTAIIDRNQLQGDGSTEDVMALGDLNAKCRAFGWVVREVNGHDFDALDHALVSPPTNAPLMILANTIKGRGVSYMEGVTEWHHHPINDEQLQVAIADIGAVGRSIRNE